MAEATAIWRALQFGKEYSLENIIIASDSLKILKGEWMIPWEIMEMTEEILQMMQDMHMELCHIFRGGNQLADYLATCVIEQDEKQ